MSPPFAVSLAKSDLLWLCHKELKFEVKEHIFYTGIDNHRRKPPDGNIYTLPALSHQPVFVWGPL